MEHIKLISISNILIKHIFLLLPTIAQYIFYSYMFRLPIVAIIRESLFSHVHSVQYVTEW
jgi:hypothetical protein